MIKEEEINALVSAIDTPPEKPSQDADGDWYPDLNKTQKRSLKTPQSFS